MKKFFSDLHRDLSDRHLLLPLIALAVAVVAVPVLLSSSPQPVAPPPPAPQSGLGGGEAVSAAVTVSEEGIRDYRERLAALKSKNPFDQQFTTTAAPDEGEADVTGAGLIDDVAAATSEGGTTTSTPGGSGDSFTSGGSYVASGAVETSPPVEVDNVEVDDEDDEPEVVEVTRLITRRINVRVGELHDTKRVEDVKNLTLLPSKSNPVVAFIGVSEDAERAAFAVSADVTTIKGDGSCAGGGPLECEFLTLEVGDQEFFRLGDKTFRLSLLRVNDHELATDRDDADDE